MRGTRDGFNRAATFPSRMLLAGDEGAAAAAASIGPRRFRRGCRCRRNRVRERSRMASIGPRRFRRGCRQSFRGTAPWPQPASIGPRRFRRGCPRASRSRCSASRSFNRAATFPSRMPRRFPGVKDGLSCFNRAATFPSRMRECRPSDGRKRKASIGPRRFRRGCARTLAGKAMILTASIGPRRFRRGCSAAAAISSRNLGASIGPRRFRRGCPLHKPTAIRDAQLQ